MDHTIALIQRSHDGDEKAREQLVEENTGLVWCIVKRFFGRGTDSEDLFQIGSIGLLKAIDKFDLNYDVKFSTYAVPMISGEIRRFLRDDGMIKVSRSLKETAYKAFLARERLQKKYNREPTMEELAAELEVEKEELAMALDASGEVESLHKPWCGPDGTVRAARGMYGGESARHARALYAACGLSVPEGFAAMPDHLALLLELEAFFLEADDASAARTLVCDHFDWLGAYDAMLAARAEQAADAPAFDMTKRRDLAQGIAFMRTMVRSMDRAVHAWAANAA